MARHGRPSIIDDEGANGALISYTINKFSKKTLHRDPKQVKEKSVWQPD